MVVDNILAVEDNERNTALLTRSTYKADVLIVFFLVSSDGEREMMIIRSGEFVH